MTSDFDPKQRFQAGPFAKDHLAWSRSEVSRAAIEAALSIMAKSYTGANLMLMEGAVKLADTLLTLSEPKGDKPKVEDRSSLMKTAPQPIKPK